MSLKGVVIYINVFNFFLWGLWEKVLVLLLVGVFVFVKLAIILLLFIYLMIKDVVDVDILFLGSFFFICGGGYDLMDYV